MTDRVWLEDGSFLWLEDATSVLLETTAPGVLPVLTSEDNRDILTEATRESLFVTLGGSGSTDTVPTITSGAPPAATAGVAFSFTFTAIASPAATWSITFGAVPPGMSLDPVTGVFSGVPTTTGTSSFTLTATNRAGSDSGGVIFTVQTGSTNASKPPPGGYFPLTPTSGGFPNDIAAAGMVHRSTWEPRPENAAANALVVTQPLQLAKDVPDFDAVWNSVYMARVTGNCATYLPNPTTDEVIQWACAKWGWPDEVVRAEMVDESNWVQSATGDDKFISEGLPRVYDAAGDPWPTSFGLPQIKWYFHPPTTSLGGTVREDGVLDPTSSYPLSRQSTAFALDYFLCILRGIYDGHSTFLGANDMWGAIGSWFSGGFHDNDAEIYIARVQGFLASKDWLLW